MATYAAFKHVELYNVGKAKKRVLRPPGGGSSDIFGNDMPATPRSAKNHMASNIFGSEQNSSVKVNGDARRAQKNGDSYSRLFGEPDRPFTPAKNHMKSSIPIGGAAPAKNGNGTMSSSSSSTNGHQHYQNGNGKMENGTTSSTSSEYQNGVSKTENIEENANSNQRIAQAPTNQSVENSNENNNNSNINNNMNNSNNQNVSNENNKSEYYNNDNNCENEVTNFSTDNHNNNLSTNNDNLSPRSQKSIMPDDNNNGSDHKFDENNSLKIITEVDHKQNERTTRAATNYQNDDGNINKNINSSSINANPATITTTSNSESSPHINHNNINMQNGDHYTTLRCGVNKSKKHNEFSSPRRDENGRPIDSNGAQLPISHRHVNMNNPNISPRSFNPRNPVTGLGVERSNNKPRKWADHKDGNPVTGEGYKPAGAEINTTIPCLNGANQVINKNRIPPGGFSSGLW